MKISEFLSKKLGGKVYGEGEKQIQRKKKERNNKDKSRNKF